MNAMSEEDAAFSTPDRSLAAAGLVSAQAYLPYGALVCPLECLQRRAPGGFSPSNVSSPPILWGV